MFVVRSEARHDRGAVPERRDRGADRLRLALDSLPAGVLGEGLAHAAERRSRLPRPLRRPRERVLFIELKAEGGKLSGAQKEWLAELERAGQDVRVWRPDDWPELKGALR